MCGTQRGFKKTRQLLYRVMNWDKEKLTHEIAVDLCSDDQIAEER